MDNRLSFTDQALFLGLRATGQELAMQSVWIYDHPVDFDGLRRFHKNFGHGFMGRLIEPSPLPFGRHRWVASQGPASALDIESRARPRTEVADWADERAQLPIDPEWGPGWHLGVLPLADGGTAISLVGSHCLTDGGGAALTVLEAVSGHTRDFGYPPPGARTRMRAVSADLWDTVKGVPEVVRTLVEVARQARRRRRDISRSAQPLRAPVSGDDLDRTFVAPAITAFVDVDAWDARANALGGTSHALVAGFAAKLAERMGRVRADDGLVTLNVPINDRTLEDTRANAVTLGDITVDPTNLTTDLSVLRSSIRRSLKSRNELSDENVKLLPLIPFLPKRIVRRTADVMFNFADLPVSCSNMGELPASIRRVDGTEAETVYMRGIDRAVTKRFLERRRGLLTVISARIGSRLMLTVVGYRPGADNTKLEMCELVGKTLAEFDLDGEIA
ncbi:MULTISPECIES: hypothetical protein [unclassified Mycobacterium]|uniref:hypothetical protein n=1 Tax=unclassified Mycobacterium TaxID=2642494 RepID=UPI0029C73FD2|nr:MULTISPECIES: hypothetical protein [unclassified Mycobacterium]